MNQKTLLLTLSALLATFFIFLPFTGQGAEETPLSLQLPSQFAGQICPVPVWHNVSVVWKGVTDKRATPEIGQQETKGEISTTVIASPALTIVFDDALRQLLPACGLILKNSGDESTTTLSVEIENFSASVQKKLLTGKGTAQSRLALIAQMAGQSTLTAEVGFEMESKKARTKNIKQLNATLNELLYDTLEQIPKARQLQDLK